MALVLTSGPAVEPVTLDDAKAHLRIDGAAEDVLLSSLILTSRLHVEAALGLALIHQTWRLVLDRWPLCGTIDVRIAPLQAVSAIHVKTSTETSVLVPPTNYLVDLASKPRIVLNNSGVVVPRLAAAGIEIDLLAGFGATAASVPAPLKHAVLMLTAHW